MHNPPFGGQAYHGIVPTAVIIDRQTKTSPTAVSPIVETIAAHAIALRVIDRYGYLDALYLEAKHWLDERDALKKEIQELHKHDPADQPVHLEGKLYLVDLGRRENERSITSKTKAFAALKKVIGLNSLVEALTYTLKVLDLHIPKEKQAAFVKTERTGPRSIRSAVKTPVAA